MYRLQPHGLHVLLTLEYVTICRKDKCMNVNHASSRRLFSTSASEKNNKLINYMPIEFTA